MPPRANSASSPMRCGGRISSSRSAMPYTTATGKTYDSGDFAGHLKRAQEIADWDGFKRRRRVEEIRAAARHRHRDLYRGLRQQWAGYRRGAARATTARHRAGRYAIDRAGACTPPYAQIIADHLGLAARARARRPGRHRSHRHRNRHRRFELDPVRRRVRRQRGGELAEESQGARGRGARSLRRRSRNRRRRRPRRRHRSRRSFADLASMPATARSLRRPQDAFAPEQPTYPNGTHIAEVEIDPETGAVRRS